METTTKHLKGKKAKAMAGNQVLVEHLKGQGTQLAFACPPLGKTKICVQ